MSKTSLWLTLLILMALLCVGFVVTIKHDNAHAAVAPLPTYTAYGTVRSHWTTHENTRSLVAFAYDSNPDQPVALVFSRLEPGLWQGMHAKVQYKPASYKELYGGSNEDNAAIIEGRQIYQLVSVTQLP